ncbi:type II toxin-antitoxin system VapB family antitoxin [Terriglobus saanensis]|uniref:Transcription regulator of the Arc/MetJ class n=1 Tax=Terriglobus saanensis (strain ATCC BAA-1853 / DSM 23119 / SP1PR4) TaxID=401053 RepID=E8V0M2_TERSS|nr:type II toxin-antitoxin system VapB family antitoxin [Terriglobus saanensis]ADV81085.1 Protein of unknown function DUF2191 [Terriglobus saanensis SP1PR4]
MRTNIEIDDALIKQVMRRGKLPTKRAAVDAALRLMKQVQSQAKVQKLWGKIPWEGDLDEMRKSRFPDWPE